MRTDPLMRAAEVMWLPPNRPSRQLPRMGVTKRHDPSTSAPVDSNALAISLHLWWLVGVASCTETREVEVVVTPYAHASGRRIPADWTSYSLDMSVRAFVRYVI